MEKVVHLISIECRNYYCGAHDYNRSLKSVTLTLREVILGHEN